MQLIFDTIAMPDGTTAHVADIVGIVAPLGTRLDCELLDGLDRTAASLGLVGHFMANGNSILRFYDDRPERRGWEEIIPAIWAVICCKFVAQAIEFKNSQGKEVRHGTDGSYLILTRGSHATACTCK